jgi:hypothetical protein
MTNESATATDAVGATLDRAGGLVETAKLSGRFFVTCYGFDATCHGFDERLKWADTIDNLVVNVGKNLALDTLLAGSGYTVVGPFMGLISSVAFSAIAPTDTMGAHSGWTEAGGVNAPTYAAPRKTAVWNPAAGGNKSLAAALSFGMTGTGTIKGAFLLLGAGAVNTIDSNAGVLYSAGLFSGGDRSVVAGDTLNISYMVSLN